jgi:hypothetical protein
MDIHEKGRRRRLVRLRRRGDFDYIRQAVGTCPSCAVVLRESLGAQLGVTHGVVYRRSRRSLTMRCSFCGLQWTMTWVKIAQAMRRQAEREGEGELADVVADIAELAQR